MSEGNVVSDDSLDAGVDKRASAEGNVVSDDSLDAGVDKRASAEGNVVSDDSLDQRAMSCQELVWITERAMSCRMTVWMLVWIRELPQRAMSMYQTR